MNLHRAIGGVMVAQSSYHFVGNGFRGLTELAGLPCVRSAMRCGICAARFAAAAVPAICRKGPRSVIRIALSCPGSRSIPISQQISPSPTGYQPQRFSSALMRKPIWRKVGKYAFTRS
jgi:hypothetical protein